jgi:hypothetical protein
MMTASCEVSVPALPSEASMTALNDMRPHATVALRGRARIRPELREAHARGARGAARASHAPQQQVEREVREPIHGEQHNRGGDDAQHLEHLGQRHDAGADDWRRDAAASQRSASGGVLCCAHSCCSGSPRQPPQARLCVHAARLGAALRPHRPPRPRRAAPTVLQQPRSWRAERATKSRSPWRPAPPPAAGRPRPAAAAPGPTLRRSERALRAPRDVVTTCLRKASPRRATTRLQCGTQRRSAAACRLQPPAAAAGAMRAFSPR